MKGLGRGLGALMSEASTEDLKNLMEVKINDIDPNIDQPRKNFRNENIEELADSIKQHGIVQPIIVIKNENRYKIVAGERRWRAAKLAGLATVPVIVKEIDEKEQIEISLIENLQRQDLNPIEEATTYKSYMEKFNLTQEEVARRIGKSRPYVANMIRLINLDERIKELIEDEAISYGHAKVLLSIDDKEKQFEIANMIIDKKWSVRETENYISNLLKETNNVKKKDNNKHVYVEIEERLMNIFNTKVNIIKGNKKSKIEIEYYSDDDLDRIIQNMEKLK